MDSFILTLYKKSQTVFTAKELSLLFSGSTAKVIKDRTHYAVRTGTLLKLRRGIYAKEGFNPLECANKLYTPSYISLETVLAKSGIIFQYYETTFAVSYLTRLVSVSGSKFQYRKTSASILTNRSGLVEENGVAVATPERAFLDAVYLYKNYHFDNLSPLDWKKVTTLQTIYHNKTLEKRIKQYQHDYDETTISSRTA